MLFVLLVCSLSLAATVQEADNDRIDPYDVLNYDPSTKTTRNPAEPADYANVPTKRREFTQDSNEVDPTSCRAQVVDQQRQIAFAEYERKLQSVFEKCSAVKTFDWLDNLKEWYRPTLTVQDGPCKEHYKFLYVDPFLLVPPTKAITYTITTLITEPLKHVGQGINEFLVALLKDQPIKPPNPVLLTIVLAIVVCMYRDVPAAFQHGVAALFRRPRGDPPPPQLEQPQPGGDAPQQAVEGLLHRNQVRQG